MSLNDSSDGSTLPQSLAEVAGDRVLSLNSNHSHTSGAVDPNSLVNWCFHAA